MDDGHRCMPTGIRIGDGCAARPAAAGRIVLAQMYYAVRFYRMLTCTVLPRVNVS
jgi:hypothetical protein